jgi:hypothetical protein
MSFSNMDQRGDMVCAGEMERNEGKQESDVQV